MRVAHILYSGIGGVFNVVNSIIKDKKKIHSVIPVGPKLSKNFLIIEKNLKKNFFYVKTIKFFSVLFFINIFYNLCKFKPDIIVLHNYQILPCILAKFFLNNKIIYVDHKPKKLKSNKDKLLCKFFDLFIDNFVVLNDANYLVLLKDYKINKSKIIKISNGINLFKNRQNKKNNNIINIGMAGRLNSTKHFDILIKSVQSLLDKKIKVRCTLAGDGEEKQKLKRIISNKNKKSFIFSGNLNQKKLNSWFKKIDLYVQASKGEAMSIAILQAMQHGIPVMGSNVEGINNLDYPNSKDQMLFDNNVKDLKKKILNYLKFNKKKRNLIIKNQLNYLRNNFSEKKMINSYHKLFEKVIN